MPYWHEVLYGAKIAASGSGALYSHIPVHTYGHCNFTVADIEAALQKLLEMTGG